MTEAPHHQSAELAVSLRPFSLTSKVVVTPTGLLSIAAMVCGILLSTAVLVALAKR